MDFIRNNRKIWTVVVIIAATALIVTSFLPYLILLGQ